jgi:serine/threonine protein kinase/WD40 repeat protein
LLHQGRTAEQKLVLPSRKGYNFVQLEVLVTGISLVMKEVDGQAGGTTVTFILDQFEEEWRNARISPLESFLMEPPFALVEDVAVRQTLLADLVAIDLEYRWKRFGQNLSLGDESRTQDSTDRKCLSLDAYIETIPELGHLADLPAHLFEHEYRIRRTYGSWSSPDDFELAYPVLKGTLGAAIREAEVELSQEVSEHGRSTIRNEASLPSLHPGPEPKRVFGHYELLSEIARGGMGVVFLARQAKVNRLVALKMIRSAEFADRDQVQRFYAEAEAAAKLDHPGIVPLFEVGEINGQHFFSLAYVDGPNLNARVKSKGPFSPKQAARLLQMVAVAVQYAHDKGIVHRDIKPHNILLDANEQPRITDFGLAKHVQRPSDLTITGDIIGTPSYMPPEQAAGQSNEVGKAADIYSLGATLYYLLSGRPPFQASSLAETIRQVIEVQPVSLTRLNPEISRDLDTICAKCLRKEPKNRYGSARDLANDLGCWLENKPISARPVGTMEKAFKWIRRQPAVAGLLATAFFFVTVVLPTFVGYRVRLNETSLKAENESIRASAAEQVANTQRYYSIVSSLRNLNRERPLGWRQESLSQIETAVGIDTKATDLVELRELSITSLSGIDLREVRSFDEGTDNSLVAVSPDGAVLATCPLQAPLGSSIKLFEVDSGKLVKELPFPSDPLYHIQKGRPNGPRVLVYSPDGAFLFAGARNGRLHCWDIRNNYRERSWIAHPETRVESIVVSLDSKIVYSTGGNSIKSWQVGQKNKQIAEFKETVDEPPFGLIIDKHEGKWVGVVGDNCQARKLLDSQTLVPVGDVSTKTDIHYGSGLDVSRCGRILAYSDGGHCGFLRSFLANGTTRTLAEDGTKTTHLANIDDIILSPDSTLCVTSSGADDDRTIKLWEVASGKLLRSINIGGFGNEIGLAFFADGRRLVTTGNKKVSLFEIVGLHETTFVAPQPDRIMAAHRYGDEGQLAMLLGDNEDTEAVRETIRWDTKSGIALGKAITHLHPSVFAVASNEHTIAWGTIREQYIVYADQELTEKAVRFPDARRIQFHPDGKTLWGITEPRLLWARSPETGNETFRWQAAPDWVAGRSTFTSLAVGPSKVAVGVRNGSVVAFDIDASTDRASQKWMVKSNAAAIDALAFNADESQLAGGDTDAVVTVRSTKDGGVLQKLVGHSGRITAVAFGDGAAGNYLASGSRDKSVRLWMRKGDVYEAVATLPFERAVKSLEFDPSGTQLLILLENEFALRVWHVDRLRESLSRLKLNW